MLGKRKLNRRSGNPELYRSCGLCNQYEIDPIPNQQQRIRTQNKILPGTNEKKKSGRVGYRRGICTGRTKEWRVWVW
jgi:hypothetical protein